MKNVNSAGTLRSGDRNRWLGCRIVFFFGLGAALLAGGRTCSAQVEAQAIAQHGSLWAGAAASGYQVQFGEQKLIGATAFVDVSTARGLGVEAEGRWLEYHNFADVHAETYLAGPRYQMHFGRFEPYVKGLVGVGNFNFPYNYAHGNYFVFAAGGGVEYRLSHRWSVRMVDFEYQDWPQFTYGAMNSVGLSSGIRYRIF